MVAGNVASDWAGAICSLGWPGMNNGPFCPHPESMAPKAIKATRRTGPRTLETRLRVLLDIQRILLTMPESNFPRSLTDSEFHALAAAVLARIEETVDRWLQDDVIDIDSSRTGGLLELSFPDGSKIVINSQSPLHELWLAARSGGFHFKCASGRWIDTRSGTEFHDVLSSCASEQAGRALRFDPA